ncbi:hypothetical protein AWC38_SpisGene22377 [Stylophora pistillata]|uniref:OTU domain-containing protein n=1 Tax=Stylophora pistillata TaxID=50429 RepID=A0A2B4R9P8_STYPI|nr:hypothetical protein AWC38_SpisGene22377 [Stylophora pistillata]
MVTPSPEEIDGNMQMFLAKWERHLSYLSLDALQNIRRHIIKGCCSGIPPGGGTNLNERLHKSLKTSLLCGATTISPELAVAVLTVVFYAWNFKRDPDAKKHCSNARIFPVTPIELHSEEEINNDMFQVERRSKTAGYKPDVPITMNIPQAPDIGIKTSSFENLKRMLVKMHPQQCENIALQMDLDKECLQRNLSSFSLEIDNIAGDGNCCFASIITEVSKSMAGNGTNNETFKQHITSLGLGKGIQQDTELLRQLFCTEIRENLQKYQSWVDFNVEEELLKFSQTGWFDSSLGDLCVFACCNMLKMPIVVITSLPTTPCIPFILNDVLKAEPIYIAFKHSYPGHYDATKEIKPCKEDVRMNKGCNCDLMSKQRGKEVTSSCENSRSMSVKMGVDCSRFCSCLQCKNFTEQYRQKTSTNRNTFTDILAGEGPSGRMTRQRQSQKDPQRLTNLFSPRHTIRIGTWNVRSMYQTGTKEGPPQEYLEEGYGKRDEGPREELEGAATAGRKEASVAAYNGKHYKQLHGTAMGSPVSVVIAEIVMQNIEERALSTCRQTIPLWLRYVDDTFTAVRHDEIDAFHNHLNEQNTDIQFTREVEENGKLPFLDCLPLGICVEHKKNTFITHAQTGSVKLVTLIKGIVNYLGHLGLLYKAFSRHMKHQTAPKRSLPQAIELLEELDSYLETITEIALSYSNEVNDTSTDKPSGPQGTTSNQTKRSANMILNGLKYLEALVKEHNPGLAIDLYSCLTVQVENLHAIGHFKDQFPTLLQYARNLTKTVYESIKRVVPWSAYYFTHDKSYHPTLRQSTPINAIPKLEHLNARRELNRQGKDLMIEWTTNDGKGARQREETVKQETPTPQKPLNPGATPFSPGQTTRTSELTDRMECLIQFMAKRELISNKIEKFDNRPENYTTWKAAFRNMTREVNITASEELALMIEHTTGAASLGPSHKPSKRPCSLNTGSVFAALRQPIIWLRTVRQLSNTANIKATSTWQLYYTQGPSTSQQQKLGSSKRPTSKARRQSKFQPVAQRYEEAQPGVDNQSNGSLAKTKLFDLLKLNGEAKPHTLKTCSGTSQVSGRLAHDLIIESLDGTRSYTLPVLTECEAIPDSREEIPTPNVVRALPHLQPIADEIPELCLGAEILLLLGRDAALLHKIHESRNGPKNAPWAQRLDLGWVVIGNTCLDGAHKPNKMSAYRTQILHNGRPSCLLPCTNWLRRKHCPLADSTAYLVTDKKKGAFVKGKFQDGLGDNVFA